jgi:hypothetical protein
MKSPPGVLHTVGCKVFVSVIVCIPISLPTAYFRPFLCSDIFTKRLCLWVAERWRSAAPGSGSDVERTLRRRLQADVSQEARRRPYPQPGAALVAHSRGTCNRRKRHSTRPLIFAILLCFSSGHRFVLQSGMVVPDSDALPVAAHLLLSHGTSRVAQVGISDWLREIRLAQVGFLRSDRARSLRGGWSLRERSLSVFLILAFSRLDAERSDPSK